MTSVLLITSSPRGDAAYSTKIATELAHGIPGVAVTVRDLAADPVPHIGGGFVHASFTPSDQRTAEQRDSLAVSDELIAEVQAADIVVIGAGMYNFGAPSTLKCWIDQITRAGVTFRYTETGPEGLIKGKKTVLVLASGGVYSTGPMAAMDHLGPYLQTILSFLGLDDIEIIRIEGVAQGSEATEKALAEAGAKAAALAAALSA